jgi:hypothetical protein
MRYLPCTHAPQKTLPVSALWPFSVAARWGSDILLGGGSVIILPAFGSVFSYQSLNLSQLLKLDKTLLQ